MTSATREPTGSRLLIVEDNADLRRALLEILQYEGFIVQSVASAEDALDWLEATQEAPHLVLTDYLLQGMDGCALLKQLRARAAWRRLPVVFLSGQMQIKEVCSGSELRPDAFIEKPFNIVDLVQTIRATITAARYHT